MTCYWLKWKKIGGHTAGESDLIDRYLDGILSEREQEEFEARCFRDDAFFMEVRERETFRQKIAKLIQADGEEIFAVLPARPNAFSRLAERIKGFFATEWEFSPARVFEPRWGHAVATAGAIAIAVLSLYKSVDRKAGVGPVNPPLVEKKAPQKLEDLACGKLPKAEDTLKLEIDVKQLYAANFAPVSHLEDWIEETTRSEGTAIDSVYSPRIGAEITGKQITFRWKMAENVPVSLRILNNREQELLARSPDLTTFPLITVRVKTAIFQEPGLYYWKIEDEYDVLFVGKFFFMGTNR